MWTRTPLPDTEATRGTTRFSRLHMKVVDFRHWSGIATMADQSLAMNLMGKFAVFVSDAHQRATSASS